MEQKDILNVLPEETDILNQENVELNALASDAFPVVNLSKKQLAAYKKIPLAGLAAMGAAFAQLPEGARTIVQTVTQTVATDSPLFVGLWPKGVSGTMTDRGLGFSGNIIGQTASGGNGIVGRMRYKLVDGGLPVKEATTTVMPVDPMLMVVAIALMTIEKKLDGIQKSVEEVLQFLKQEKQSKQRGNLNMLAEIMEDYKLKCNDETFCMSRVKEVLSIKKDAFQDIDFYQNQIVAELQKQKGLHGAKESQNLLDAVVYQFAEYQLACHIYAFGSFLDVMLRRDFSVASIQNEIGKMETMAKRYHKLYSDCHAQIAKYQRSAIESQIIGGVGIATKGLGKAIAAVPIVREGPVDEALISAAESIGKFNKNTVQKKLKVFEVFENNRMTPFADNLESIKTMYNTENAVLTDGVNLYTLQAT